MDIGSTAFDYKNAAIALSPKGQCWPTDDESIWVKLLDAIAQEFARIDGRAVDLSNEAFPNTSTELLENWERIVGLPDQYSDPDATIEERRNAVLFKLQARGGQSAAYIEGLINALGYQAMVFGTPLISDISVSGDFLLDESWIHYFLVVIQLPISSPELIEARIRSIKPAQSEAVFHYLSAVPGTGGLSEIEDLIASLGVTALVYEGDTMTAGISISDGFVFDSTWIGWFLVIAQNPVADRMAFEAEVLALQPNTIFYYVDDLTDF